MTRAVTSCALLLLTGPVRLAGPVHARPLRGAAVLQLPVKQSRPAPWLGVELDRDPDPWFPWTRKCVAMGRDAALVAVGIRHHDGGRVSGKTSIFVVHRSRGVLGQLGPMAIARGVGEPRSSAERSAPDVTARWLGMDDTATGSTRRSPRGSCCARPAPRPR